MIGRDILSLHPVYSPAFLLALNLLLPRLILTHAPRAMNLGNKWKSTGGGGAGPSFTIS